MPELPVCAWRTAVRGDDCACASPRFVAAPNVVPAAFCRTCAHPDHPPPPAAGPALPCVHLGGAAEVVPLFRCALHGRCDPSPGAGDGPARGCAGCADHLPRNPFAPSSAAMRARADAFLAGLPDYPAGRYAGRGVVIAGGGARFFASLYVTVRALRHVGCRLPIQVWYLGRNDEMPADRAALLAPYGVECVDADAVRGRHPARRLGGWELKVFAILHSPFAEVLFLDADCYPCRDPSYLFDLPDYRAAGAIFWPDLPPVDPRLFWPAFGVDRPGRTGSVESGQLVLNKERSWRPLNLAWFYNDHSDYYYAYGYGDKHTLEVAWARCGQPFVMWRPTARWHEVAYLHDGPDDAPLFVHRCGDKFRLRPEAFATPQRHPGPSYQPALPLEAHCWDWLGALALALYANRPADTPAPERIVRVGLPGRFNCSLIDYRGRLLLAARRGETGGRLDLVELGPDLQPRHVWPLELTHPDAATAHEDPRLFVFAGRLHCAFVGATFDGTGWRIQQMVCRLDDAFRVEAVWRPDYAGRTPVEKNWQFFEHDGALYSVYGISPEHVVLRHQGARAERAAATPSGLHWPGCHLRGGAPPVRVGDEYYHFFHAVDVRGPRRVYTAGLYTFAAEPPFAVRRAVPGPLLAPDEHDRPAGWNVSVVFPCGAVRRDDCWLLSYGYHDHECRIAVFAADAIEQALRPVEAC